MSAQLHVCWAPAAAAADDDDGLQLEVRDYNTGDVCFKGRVGNTVNNALHVAQHSNGEWRA
jgi:hypothetical protein